MTELRDYQENISDKASEILNKFHIVYLAMEVRTGKTLTALATAKKYKAKKVLFVTKKKAIEDIQSQADQMEADYFLYVTNYEQLHKVEPNWDVCIIDEAHSIGAFPTPSERAKNLKRICKGSAIILMSGTPTPESYSQIYHQFWISDYSPFSAYQNFYKWASEFVTIGRKFIYNRAINDYKNANYNSIKPIIDLYMLSYTQEQAGFESFVDEEIVRIKMSDNIYILADYLKKNKIARNKDGEVILADAEVKLMNKLHQIFSGTVILEEPVNNAKVLCTKKAEYIRDNFSDKKVAVFYKFRAEYAMLYNIFFDKITTDPVEFRESSDKIFASQIVSGREGINLSTADVLIFINIDFSAVSYWQSRARIQTKDREKESKIYYLFADNGIEDKIHKAVMNKKDYTLNHFKQDYL